MKEILKKIFSDNQREIDRIEHQLYSMSESWLKVEKGKQYDKIRILKTMSFYDFLNHSGRIDSYKIPVRMFLRDNDWLAYQTLYITEKNDIKYIIATNENILKISKSFIEDGKIKEITLDINKSNGRYKVSKYLHNTDHSTISVKWYPLRNQTMSFFVLEENEANGYANELLIDLNELQIKEVANLDVLAKYLKVNNKKICSN